MVNMDQNLMQSKGISPSDMLNALNAQNVVLPSGTAKIGQSEYDVRINTAPRTIAELNKLPIKQIGRTTIYIRDVATVSEGFAVQTNIVRQDGHRGVLINVVKSGNASTLDVVKGMRGFSRVSRPGSSQLKMVRSSTSRSLCAPRSTG